MNVDKLILAMFSLNDDGWLRHANPWSVWTRFATLPFIVIAIWSRVWIGWYCLMPLVLLLIWIVINPTLFNKPKRFTSWASRAVLGERIYMQKKAIPIPVKHILPITIINVLQGLSGAILVYGLWDLNAYLTIHGTASIYLSKMWFLDRMVWLYEDSNAAQA